jgi:hypothetical protein
MAHMDAFLTKSFRRVEKMIGERFICMAAGIGWVMRLLGLLD